MKNINFFIIAFSLISLTTSAQLVVKPNGKVEATANVSELEPALRVTINNEGATCYDLRVADNNSPTGYTSTFYVHGAGGVYSATGNFFGSDGRIKEDLARIVNPLEILMLLNGVNYMYLPLSDWTSKTQTEYAGTPEYTSLPEDNPNNRYGFIAQDVAEVLPGAVTTAKNGALGVRYEDIIPILVEGIKAQQVQIEELQTKVEELSQDPSSNLNKSSIFDPSSAKTNELYQNRPNPFNESTTIAYRVNPASQQAKLYVHSINGSQILEKDLEIEGTEVILSANSLESGLYIYSLVVDGEIIDSKKMIIED